MTDVKIQCYMYGLNSKR